MGRAFTDELDRIANTLAWAQSVPTRIHARDLGEAPTLCVVIGSGGSFTAATALAASVGDTGRGLGLPLTPLQYVQRAHTLPQHSALLVSAEGKNRDILHAARKAFSAAALTDVLTFSCSSPLVDLANGAPSARVLCFDPPWGRDGYLATNSLLASVVLGIRMGGSVVDAELLASFLGLYRASATLNRIADEVARTRRLLALHGADGLVAVVDLESKLAEAAFAFTQVTDFRQFAHGRHIQLDRADAPVPVIAFVGLGEKLLWRGTRMELPAQTTVVECALPAEPGNAAIAGLLMVMALVEKIAFRLGQDPGQPLVPEFARRIHALDPSLMLPRAPDRSANPKLAVLDPLLDKRAAVKAGVQFIERLGQADIAAVALDFDGTICETARRYEGLDERLAPLIIGLLEAGLTIAFASGRGDSLHQDLRRRLPPETWPNCVLGFYSGSLVTTLDQDWTSQAADPHLSGILQQLEDVGVRKDRGFELSARAAQLTIRGSKSEGVDVLFTLCSSLIADRTGWRVFRSAHSVDILAPSTSKTSVITYLVGRLGVDPLTEILRVGDRGEASGNDAELLAQGLGLSVDGVNDDPYTCWLLGDLHLGPVERAAHYLGALIAENRRARFDPGVLQRWRDQLT